VAAEHCGQETPPDFLLTDLAPTGYIAPRIDLPEGGSTFFRHQNLSHEGK
jgi:hypothetical protein